MKPETDIVYWVLTAVPVVLLIAQLLPLVPRGGVWFFTTPTRDQWITLGLFAFMVALAFFGVRRLGYTVFIILAGTAVLLQSWGPKRWKAGRVYGVHLGPLKVRGWVRQEGQILVRLSWGCSVAVPATPQNQGFFAVLEGQFPDGKATD